MAGLTKIKSDGIGDGCDLDGEGTLVLDSTNNRVGIGTNSPTANLHVFNSSANSTLAINNNDTGSALTDGLTLISATNGEAFIAQREAASLNISTSNTERMRIDASGRVLIGTTTSVNATFKFQVVGKNTDSGDASTRRGLLLRYGAADTNSAPIRFEKNRSNTGGTTSVASGDDLGQILFAGTDQGGIYRLGATIDCEVDATPANDTVPGRLIFYTTPVGTSQSRQERMRIDSSGRLLVGTSTYAGNGKLVAAGNTGGSAGTLDITWTGSRPTAANTDIGYIRWYVAENSSSNAHYASIYASSDGASSGTGDIPGRLVFSTTADGASSPTERMRINSTGHVYIGTAADHSSSNYAQTSGKGNFLYRADNGSTAGSIILATNSDRGWSPMYINRFNWTSSGADGRMIQFGKNGSTVASIELNSSGAIAYNTGSDYRLKENVVPLTDGITRIKQLLPKQFNMIDDPNNFVCDGFLAHEAQTVVPQAVCGTHNGMKTDEEGNEIPDYQNMDYGKLTPLLTAALQEAIGRIETLEAEVAALKSN